MVYLVVVRCNEINVFEIKSKSIYKWSSKNIDVINTCTCEYNLSLNLNKTTQNKTKQKQTKSLLFTKRGFIMQGEKCFIEGNPIELCDKFLHLGVMLKYNGNFNENQRMLSNQGRKAGFSLFNNIQDDC